MNRWKTENEDVRKLHKGIMIVHVSELDCICRGIAMSYLNIWSP